MSSLVLSGDTSGSITVSAPAVAGSNTQTLVATTGTLAPIVSGTAVASTSGTSIDFTSLPSWVKRITVMFSGVSLSGTSNILVQIGTGGTPTTSGYTGSAGIQSTAPTTSVALYTTGFGVSVAGTAAVSVRGNLQICLLDLATNSWVASGAFGYSSTYIGTSGGIVSLSGALNMVRITTVNGTDTFDAGTINILYE